MKRLKFEIINLIIILAIINSSCKKENDAHPEEHPNYSATITIGSPTTNQEFMHHATIVVSGKIEADNELHGYKLVIRKRSDGTEKFSKQEHAHGNVIEFNETWINDLEIHQDMELEVIAVLDHDGNTINKKVNFHCHGMSGE